MEFLICTLICNNERPVKSLKVNFKRWHLVKSLRILKEFNEKSQNHEISKYCKNIGMQKLTEKKFSLSMQYTGLLKFLLHECKLKCISERKVLHSYLCKMSLNGGKLRSKILVKRGHYTWSIYWPGGGSRSCFWRYRLLVFCKHPHLWFTWFFILWPFLSDPP